MEIEDSNMGEMFQSVFSVFMHELKSSNEAGRLMEKKLRALNQYIDTISRSTPPYSHFFNFLSSSVVNELPEITKEEKIKKKLR